MGDILFRDDFEKQVVVKEGPPVEKTIIFDPRWQTFKAGAGYWDVERQGKAWGTFTIQNASEKLPMTAFVGDPTWQDYTVTVDILFDNPEYFPVPWRRDHQIMIFLRVQDPDNLVAFFVYRNGQSGFDVKKKGRWQGINLTGEAPQAENIQVLISVKGDTYTAFVNNVPVATLKDNTFDRGYTGVQMAVWRGTRAYFDNFAVRAIGRTAEAIGQPEKPEPLEAPDKSDKPEVTPSGLQEIGKRLGNLETQIGRQEQDIASLKSTMAGLTKDHQTLTADVQALTDRVDSLEKKPTEPSPDLNTRLEEIQQSLASLKQMGGDNQQQLNRLQDQLNSLRGEVGQTRSLAQLGLLTGAAGVALALLLMLRISG
jgi:uncharacterized coiled-coil protein SlyX